ncbi:hypothetical protein XENTR_v10007814 [Xenopus tropicalis]|nr:hypothetical protein XENTR_v10007814 [Xenopus tropicalis]
MFGHVLGVHSPLSHIHLRNNTIMFGYGPGILLPTTLYLINRKTYYVWALGSFSSSKMEPLGASPHVATLLKWPGEWGQL